jgi:hypothetical protein
MSRTAVPACRRLSLVLCLCLALPPMRVSAQTAYDKGEFATRRERVLAGMPDGIAVITVFNVEPILEIPDRKIHIRLEDTIVVTDTGADNLTAAVPAEVDPLYALIRQKEVNSAPLADRTSR